MAAALLVLDDAAVREALPMAAAVEVNRKAFLAVRRPRHIQQDRTPGGRTQRRRCTRAKHYNGINQLTHSLR